MRGEVARPWIICGTALLVLFGFHWLYRGFMHAQTHGLAFVFVLTLATMLPIALVMSVAVIRDLNSMKQHSMTMDRKRLARGPYYINFWIVGLAGCALISSLVFHFERFGSVEAWESWTLSPPKRTMASLATTILKTATGAAWIVVPGSELAWWLGWGKR